MRTYPEGMGTGIINRRLLLLATRKVQLYSYAVAYIGNGIRCGGDQRGVYLMLVKRLKRYHLAYRVVCGDFQGPQFCSRRSLREVGFYFTDKSGRSPV